jgi:small-conductance mechanosensitive channel
MQNHKAIQMKPKISTLLRFAVIIIPITSVIYGLYYEVALNDQLSLMVRMLGGSLALLLFASFMFTMRWFVNKDKSYRMPSFYYNLTAYLVCNVLLALYVIFGGPVWQNLAGQLTGWGVGLAFHFIGFRFSVAKDMSKEELFK